MDYRKQLGINVENESTDFSQIEPPARLFQQKMQHSLVDLVKRLFLSSESLLTAEVLLEKFQRLSFKLIKRSPKCKP